MVLKEKLNSVQKPLGLGAQVADTLTQAILEGEFTGGDQLVEQDLQQRFGVSRSPLREAYRELEKKGLVEILPRKGTFVKRITRKDIEENFPIRAVLEGLAAKLATHNMSETALAQMGDALDQMETAVKSKDTKTYYTHHLRFHEIFIGLSRNELLMNTLQTLRMLNMWHRFSYQYYREDLEQAFRVHQEIFTLFKDSSADSREVGDLVERHISVAFERFLAYLEDFEQE